jgi:hypothetical protein
VKNLLLSSRTAHDIDKHVDRILRDLGNPEPPIKLEEVRELLRLDLGFYSATDEGFLKEVIHALKVGARQVVERPTLLLEAIQALDLKALLLPDRKRILLDRSLPILKQKWSVAHETIHSVLPWHGELAIGDTKLTLTPACHEQIEAEANYGAGRLLFLGDLFAKHARDMEPTMKNIMELHNLFGNTITTTLWRYVEGSSEPLFGMVSVHPHYLPEAFDAANPCRYFVRSPEFALMFPYDPEAEIFRQIGEYCGYKKAGPLGTGTVVLIDINGAKHFFGCETFSNRYEVLTIGARATG